MEGMQCSKYATMWQADSLWSDNNISGINCWYLPWTSWALSSDGRWINFGKWKAMLLSPCTVFTSATLATLFLSPLGKDRDGWQRGSLTSTEWIILSIWLLKSSSAKAALLQAFTWHTNMANTVPIQKGLATYLSFPDLLITNFPKVFLLSPWPSGQTISHCPEFSRDTYLWTFLLQTKWITRHTDWISANWENHSPWSLGLLMVIQPFVVPTYHAAPSVNQTWVFISSVICDCRKAFLIMASASLLCQKYGISSFVQL